MALRLKRLIEIKKTRHHDDPCPTYLVLDFLVFGFRSCISVSEPSSS